MVFQHTINIQHHLPQGGSDRLVEAEPDLSPATKGVGAAL